MFYPRPAGCRACLKEGLNLSLALDQPPPVLTWFQVVSPGGNVCAGPEAPLQLLEKAGLASTGTQSSTKLGPSVSSCRPGLSVAGRCLFHSWWIIRDAGLQEAGMGYV